MQFAKRKFTSISLILGLLSTTMISSAGYTVPAETVLELNDAIMIEEQAHSVVAEQEQVHDVAVASASDVMPTQINDETAQAVIHEDTIELFDHEKRAQVDDALDQEDQAFANEYESEFDNFLDDF